MWLTDYPRRVGVMEMYGTLADALEEACDLADAAYWAAVEDGLSDEQVWEAERKAVRDWPVIDPRTGLKRDLQFD